MRIPIGYHVGIKATVEGKLQSIRRSSIQFSYEKKVFDDVLEECVGSRDFCGTTYLSLVVCIRVSQVVLKQFCGQKNIGMTITQTGQFTILLHKYFTT